MLSPYMVLDFTDERGEIGPMLFGDLGADVIRVELPGGSAARTFAPHITDAPEHLQSLQFIAFNRNKRSIVLDPQSDEDIECLRELIRRADFIFESAPSRSLGDYGIGYEDAKTLNPRIIYTRISPFGDSGPHADYLANDLVLAAMGGPVILQGPADRAPVRLSVPQVWRHAGVEAAAGALAAHAKMVHSGAGAFVDLSAQSVMTWTMLNAMDAYAIQGFDFERGGAAVNTGGAKIDIVHPTSDGYIVALPMSSVLKGCRPWMVADGIAEDAVFDIDWDEYDLNVRNPDAKPLNLAQVVDMCRRFFINHTKQELFEYGLEHGITLAPVNTLAELLAQEHMKFRDYWRHVELPNGQAVRMPGLWSKTSTAPLRVQCEAPDLNQHGDEIRAEMAEAQKENKTEKSYPAATDGKTLPFEGVKVADFAWVGVGPISAKYLADHGATVVRVESESRPDVLRGNGPFKDAEEGWNRSQFFGDFNTSKQSLTLNMKTPEAIEIARKLITQSDVLIESFAPGAIERMGLGYEEVRKLNPGLIMISTCLMGQTGPAANLAGYGYHAAAIAGFYEVIGWPDLGPSSPWVAYTDTIAPRFVSALLAAALDHRRRTGEGCFIDVAQIETALHFLGPEILDLQTNGTLARRNGNRSSTQAPQGCYRCAGEDNWCAVAVDTEEQWAALCQVISCDEWISSMPDHGARIAAHDEIDQKINAWTQDQDAATVMEHLQAAGVPAGVVQRSRELLTDEQYAHRQFYRYIDHPEMGNVPYAGHQYRISNYDNGPRGPAPLIGEHSFEVLSEMLKLSDEEIGSAYASGAIN